MASHSVAAAKHATLSASTVDTVTIGSSDVDTAYVVNIDGAAIIYATGDGTAPTVAGDDIPVVVPALAGAYAVVDVVGSAVKLISAGTPKYAVIKGGLAGGPRGFGAGSGGSGTSVTLATETAGTGTKSNVSASASSVTVLAANTSRKRWSVFNDSTAILYLDTTGGTASATSYTVQIPAGSYFEGPRPVNTGLITGIWASATGTARVVEFA